MLDRIIWWIGAAHGLAYLGFCSIYALTWVVWRTHKVFHLNVRIFQWHAARWRWKHRHERGLSHEQWRRGEPRP